MNTLREIGEFVGITHGSLAAARYQYAGQEIIGLKIISALVSEYRITSMRAIIEALQNLTPMTLEAEIVGSRSGDDPFAPLIRVNPAGGITWFTTVRFIVAGKESSYDIDNAGGDFSQDEFGVGDYQFRVTRVGISNTGFVTLDKDLGTISVFPHQELPPPPPPPPPPLIPPTISVQSNGDGSFKVSGHGFEPPDTVVTILVGYGTFTNPTPLTVTAVNGAFTDFPTGNVCEGKGTRFFEATDGRISQGKQLFSNTVQMSCPV